MSSERVQRQIDRFLDEAEEALARYDWEAVQKAAQAVLAIAPNNDDAATFLAAAERAQGVSVPSDNQPLVPSPATKATASQPTSFSNGPYQGK